MAGRNRASPGTPTRSTHVVAMGPAKAISDSFVRFGNDDHFVQWYCQTQPTELAAEHVGLLTLTNVHVLFRALRLGWG